MDKEQVKISGFLKRVLRRDQKTGYSTFIITTDDKRFVNQKIGEREVDIIISGIIPILPHKSPLIVTGYFKNKRDFYFYALKCEQKSTNDAFTIQFLKQKYFSGIGEKSIEKIIEVINGDIFEFCAQDKAVELLVADNSGIRINVAQLLVEKIRELKNLEHLLHYLVKFGGDYLSSKEIYKKYGDDSISVIEENPYLLSEVGLSYEAREAIAKERGINAHADIRIKEIIKECFKINESRGNTCLSLKNILKTVKIIENRSNMGYNTNPLVIISYLFKKTSEYVYREDGDDLFFYTRRMYEIEQRAARHIVRLSRTRIDFPVLEDGYSIIEDETGISYSKEQREAFDLFRDSGVKILTGGPGTGKSTVIDGLLKYYRKLFPDNSIALCAPTGAAAKKLREVTKEDAKTIHKLLDVKPFGKDNMRYKDEYDQLPYDLVIVDESSMIDIELFMMLLSGVKSGALVLFVGDEDQLPSVAPGNVLHDMLDSGYIYSCRLKKVYRQKGNSSIVENSIRIRNGNASLIQDSAFEIITVNNEIELKEKAVEMISFVTSGKKDKEVKVYSPVRNTRYLPSTFFMNKELQHLFNESNQNRFNSIVYDGITFSIGDPIIMVRNNYELGYMNGDEGAVSDIVELDNGDMQMNVIMEDGMKYEIPTKFLSDVELAYVITIHKSQGAECNTAIILLPKNPVNMLERSLIYVGATRAKQKNIIITERDALEIAIGNSNKRKRFSGLNAQVRKFVR